MHTRSSNSTGSVTTAPTSAVSNERAMHQTILQGSITKKVVSRTGKASCQKVAARIKADILSATVPATPLSPASTCCSTISASPSSSCSYALPSLTEKAFEKCSPMVAAIPTAVVPPLPTDEKVDETLSDGAPIAREAQYSRVLSLLRSAMSRMEAPSRSIYVSGTPGTGKTLTVRAALRSLARDPRHSAARQVFVNCASVSSASHLLTLIAETVGAPHRMDPADSLREFADSDGPPALVVVDEIDLLLAPGSAALTALYALFELPARVRSRIAVLAIANAADLPTRALPWLSASPARPHAVAFQPYNADALSRIARTATPCAAAGLAPVALSLAAKKAAAAGGDARRMLDVCRRADAALRSGAARNAFSAVATASAAGAITLNSANSGASVAAATVTSLPTHQQLALCVAANATLLADRASSRSQQSRATLGGLYESFRRMCTRVHVPVVPFDEFADFCSGALAQHALLDVYVKVRGRPVTTLAARQVRLRVSVEDIRSGLSEKPLLQRLITK